MSKAMPTIQKYMTVQPHTIQFDHPLSEAEKEMSGLKVRHLPVVDASGKLIGIVSDRDIKMAESLVGSDPNNMTVENICHKHPYEVSPDSPLDEVASEMAAKRYGSAIVTQNDRIVGIFTTVDACKALTEVLHTRFHG